MQLWFARASGITLREQLVTQVILGILSEDLRVGERLPSTREIARRFHLHPNTVSAGYRQLEREGWVEARRGSGIYVRRTKPQKARSPIFAFDQLVAELFRAAHRLGISLAAAHARLRQWLELQPPDHYLLIEPDRELARIVAAELREALKFPIEIAAPDGDSLPSAAEGAVAIALASSADLARRILPAGCELVSLQVRSVPKSLAEWLPAPPGALVGIASAWPGFLKLARTVLAAAGFPADGLMLRDARQPNWRRGLRDAAAVVCDTLIAKRLAGFRRVVPFPIISGASLDELRRYEELVRNPLR